VTQRNLGVWLGLGLIAVIVGLDLVGGGNAELLGLLVGPPILAASFRSLSTSVRQVIRESAEAPPLGRWAG
jgi:hypothetical protein